MSRFLRIFAIIFSLIFVGNAFADNYMCTSVMNYTACSYGYGDGNGGAINGKCEPRADNYSCATDRTYSSCKAGYYLTYSSSSRADKYYATATYGNACSPCPSNATYCRGDTYAPMYEVTLNHNGGTGSLNAIYASTSGGWYINTTSTSLGTKITKLPSVPTKTGCKFNGYAQGSTLYIDENGEFLPNLTGAGMSFPLSASWTCMDTTVSTPTKTYDGTALACDGVTVASPEGVTKEYSTDGGSTWSTTVPTLTDAGATAIRYRLSMTGYTSVTGGFICKVNKAANTLTLSASSGNMAYSSTKTFTVSKNTSGGTLSVATSNSDIATATISGTTVTITSKTGYGTADVTVTSAATTNYNAASAKYTITVDLGTITLNNQSANTAGTTAIYQKYNTNVYLDSARSKAMTSSANPITIPEKTGYTFKGYYSAASGGTQYINANGYVTTDGLSAGKALEANGTWYAQWTANTFNVRYNMTGGIPSAWLSKGYDMMSEDDVVESCVYDGACAVKANWPGSDTFKFLGWKCTSSNCPDSLKDKLLQTGDSLQNATAVNGAEITLTAQWAVRTYPVNVYAKGGDTTPIGTVYYVYNDSYYASEEAATNHTVLTDLYTAVTKPTNGDNQLRGWVFGDNYDPVSATPVEVDTESLVEEYLEDAVFATKDGNFTLHGGDGWFYAGEDNQTLSVYGTWAKNCATPSNGTCSLTVNSDGSVAYTASCNTGYTVSGTTTATPSCTADCNVITLNANSGTAGSRATLYKKTGDTTWYKDANCTSGYTSEDYSSVVPSRDGYTFRGFYKNVPADITATETNGVSRYLTHTGATTNTGTSWTVKADATLYAGWAKNCAAGTNCTCTLTVGMNTVYETSAATGYNIKSGSSTYAPICQANIFSISYAGNSNTGGSAPTSPTSCTYDEACTAPANTYTRTNYVFTGWKCTGGTTACDGDIIAAGGSLKNVSTGSAITLTAQWSACEGCSGNTGANCALSVVNNACTYTTTCKGGYYNITNNGKYNASCSVVGDGWYSADKSNDRTQCTTTDGWTTATGTTTASAYTSCYQTQTPAKCSAGTVKRTASSISGTTITYGSASVTSALKTTTTSYVNGTSCLPCGSNSSNTSGSTATTCTCTSGYTADGAVGGASTSTSGCTAIKTTITLANNSATTNGTTPIYAQYNTNAYLDSARSKVMTTSANGITVPVRKYTVTYDANGGSVGTTSQTATYTFKGYYSTASSTTQYIAANGFITNDGISAAKGYTSNVQWNAQWTSASVTMPTPTRTGYTFKGWSTSSTATSGSTGSYTPTANVKFYATWTPNTYTVTLRDYADSTTHSTIYEKYATGWYSDSGASTALSKASVPTRDGYKFRGFYTEKQSDLTASGGSGTRRISADGTLPGNTTFTSNTPLYAAWAKNCTAPSNGTCSLTINSDGTATYTASCNTGYTVSGATTATPSCTADCNVITLNPNNGTAGSRSTLYKKTGDTTWYKDANCTSGYTSADYSSVVPSRSGWTFRGFYLNSENATDISATQTNGAARHLTQNGGYGSTGGAGWSITADATLYAGWAKNCAPGNQATCTLTVGQNTKYTTGCNAGYNIKSGSDAYNPVCQGNTITLSWANGGRGTAPTTPASCMYGSTFTAPAAMTATGYTFSKWSVNNKSFSAGATINCTSADLGVTSGTATITGTWNANSGTKYVVNHYTKNLGASTYTLHSTDNNTGTTDGTLTLANLKTSITGFTYSEGFAGTATKGTTKPSSGAVTSTTILADGTRVIDLYYTRNTYTITVAAGHGVSTVAASGWTNTGTASMSKSFEYGASIALSSVVTPSRKTGYTGTSYSKTSGSGTLSGTTFTVGAGVATITVAATGISAPTAAITPASTTKVYNYEATTLTAKNNTSYDSNISVYYSFGSSSSSTGSYSYGTASTTATTSVSATSHRGTKYYKVQVYATDGTLTSSTVTSDAASVTLNNKTITFNENGGTLSGSSSLYAAYATAALYTSSTGTTEGTIPTASKTGYTFKGWYTAASGGNQIYNASGALTSVAVSGFTSGSKWVATENKTLYAQWTANTYTVSYDLNGGSYGTNHPTSASFDTAFTVNNPTHAHGTFAGWKITGMDGVTHTYGSQTTTSTSISSTTATSFKNLRSTSGTVTFTAIWTCAAGYQANDNCGANTITLSWANGGRGTAPTTPASCMYGSTFTAPAAMTATGYTFSKWSVNNKSFSAGATINCTSADLGVTSGTATITGTWNAHQYTVTFKTGDKTMASQTFTYGTAQKLTAVSGMSNIPVSGNGWSFVGWSTAADSVAEYTDAQSVSNLTATSGGSVTLYGVWKRNVTFKYYDGASATSVTTNEREQRYHNTSATAASASGVSTYALATQSTYKWVPVGWVLNSNTSTSTASTATTTTTTVAPAANAAAVYTALYNRTVTVAYNGNSNTSGSTSNTTGTQYYNVGNGSAKDLSLTLANNGFVRTGYTFSKWAAGSTSGTQYAAGASYTFPNKAWSSNASATMYAIWTLNSYSITISKNGGSGTLTVNGVTQTGTTNVTFSCSHGDTFTLPAWSSASGTANQLSLTKKVFTGWSVSGTVTCDSAKTISAQWTTPTCTAGTGVASTSLSSVSGNAPVCNRSSKCGYYCSATQTGSAGATSLTTTCTKTDSGYYAAAGATTQTKASAGYYAAAGACGQTACGGGKWSAAGSATCSNINAGCYGTSAGSACPASCAKGTYSTGGAASCTNVTAGCYADTTGSTKSCPKSCSSLGGGLYKNSTAGSDAETDCYFTTTAGKYISDKTATAETLCEEKYYCPATTLYYPNTGSKQSCPDPTLSEYKEKMTDMDWLTERCPDANASNSSISTANWQSWSNTGLSAITQCPASYTVQTPCATFTIGSATYNSSTSAYDTDKGGIYADNVKAGYYLLERYSDTYCDGKTENDWQKMIYDKAARCPENSFCPGGSVPRCYTGTYNETWGATSCSSLNAGYDYSAGGTSATSSAACYLTLGTGKFVETAGANQKTCTAGGYCDKAGTKIYYGSTGGRTACSAGTANASSGSSSSSACVTCAAGTYNTTTGNTTCSTCTENYYCTGGSNRTACAAPYSTSVAGAKSNAYCYLTTSSTKYVAEAGKGEVTCAAGGYCPGGSKVYYASGVGSTTGGRTACTANSSSAAGSDAISDCSCNAGYSGNAATSGGTCSACAKGTYKASAGNTTCTNAGTGYYVDTEAAVSRKACTDFRVNTSTTGTQSTASSACVCVAGRYLNSSNVCDVCAAGSYKSGKGNDACTLASKNYYVDGTGKTSQIACTNLGEFYTTTASTGSTSDKCYGTTTAGKYIKTANSSTQETCPAGSYCPATTVYYGKSDTTGGRTACSSLSGVSVSGGSYTSAAGSDASTDCKYTAPAPGVPTYCATKTSNTVTYSGTAWPTSTYSVTAKAGSIISGNNTASATCSQCDGAVFSAGGTATSCTSCPAQTSGWTRATGKGWTSYKSCKQTQKPANCASGGITQTATSATAWGASSVTTDLTANANFYVGETSCPSCSSLGGGLYNTSEAGNSGGTSACKATVEPGYYLEAKTYTKFTPCTAGYYCPGTTLAYDSIGGRTQCPAGYRDGTTGYSAESQCLMNVAGGKFVKTAKESSASGTCAQGYAKAQHAVNYGSTSSCDACTGATYADTTGQATCTACPTAVNPSTDKVIRYSYWNTGKDADHTSVEACQAYFDLETLDTGTARFYCYVDTNSVDKDTNTATYGIDGSSWTCFVRRSGATCNGGYYNSTFAADSNATQLAAGTTLAAARAAACTPVESGYWSPADVLTRTACPSGYVNGSATAASESECAITVPGGHYIGADGDNSDNWDTCANWTYKPEHTVYYGQTSSCTACPTVPDAVDGVAWTKASGTGWDAYNDCVVTQTPAHCASGSVKKTASTASAWGETKLVDTLKSKDGYYANSTAIKCSAAQAGYFATAGATNQTACVQGSYTSTTGQSACIACGSEESKYTTTNDEGEEVTVGTWGLTTTGAGQTSCNATCSNATDSENATAVKGWAISVWNTDNTVSDVCIPASCAKNHFLDGENAQCPRCDSIANGMFPYSSNGTTKGTEACYLRTNEIPGRYVDITEDGEVLILPCPKATFSVGKETQVVHYGTETSSCTYCAGNTYQDEEGQTECKACPAGYTEYWGGDDYDGDGKDSDGRIDIKSCRISCPAGTYIANVGDSECTPVGPGYWAAATGKPYIAYGTTSERGQCPSGQTTIGYGAGANEAGDCGRVLHIGDGQLYLRSDKKTTPSLNVKVGNTTFYGNMTSTEDKYMSHGVEKSLKVNYNDDEYSVYDDSGESYIGGDSVSISLDPTVKATSTVPANYNAGDGLDWSAVVSGVELSGIGRCDSNAPSSTTMGTIADADFTPSGTGGAACWCKMTSPNQTSKWILGTANIGNDAAKCASKCGYYCTAGFTGTKATTHVNFRTNMYNLSGISTQ